MGHFVFDVLPEERLPPTWEDALWDEPDQGTIKVDVFTLLPVFEGYANADFYYQDGFAKQVRTCTEQRLRTRFPKSYPK